MGPARRDLTGSLCRRAGLLRGLVPLRSLRLRPAGADFAALAVLVAANPPSRALGASVIFGRSSPIVRSGAAGTLRNGLGAQKRDGRASGIDTACPDTAPHLA